MLSKIKFEAALVKIELDVRIQLKDAVSPYRTIDWESIKRYQELSICATIWRRSSPKSIWRESMFGQCLNPVREHAGQLPEGERVALEELVSIWERWHLNGLNAGLRPQRDALRSKARTDPGVFEYSAACKYLETLGLLTTVFTQYTYGDAWLVELLPDDVEQSVRRICRTLGAKVLEAA